LVFRKSRRSSRTRPNAGGPAIEAGISEVMATRSTVRCVVANVELAAPGSDDLVAEARRIFADDLADVGEIS
jgi:hypothetical protein